MRGGSGFVGVARGCCVHANAVERSRKVVEMNERGMGWTLTVEAGRGVMVIDARPAGPFDEPVAATAGPRRFS